MQINKTFLIIILSVIGLAVTACQNLQSSGGANAAKNTPTEAYKSLWEAVKSKNTDAIKSNMSKTTIEFVEGVAQMQKKTPEEMYKNGLTETTMGDKLPPIRNERVKENMGAIEVQNPKGVWEDLPFVLEDGRWKLAVGDLFKNTYNKPAPSQAETEANNNIAPIMPSNANMNMNPTMNGNAAGKPDIDKKPEKPTAKQNEKNANK